MDADVRPQSLPEKAVARGLEDSRMLWALFVALAIAQAMPWCALAYSLDYFAFLHPGGNTILLLPTVFMYTATPTSALMVMVGSRVPLSALIPVGLMLQSCLLLVTPVLANTAAGANYLLAVFALSGLADGVLASSLLGMASRFPPRYRQILSYPLAAWIVPAIQLVTKLTSFDASLQSQRGAATVFFTITATLTAVGAAAYACMLLSPHVQSQLRYTAAAHQQECISDVADTNSTESLQDPLLPPPPVRPQKSLPFLRDFIASSWSSLSISYAVRADLAAYAAVKCVLYLLFPAFVLTRVQYNGGGFGHDAAFLGTNGWWPLILNITKNVSSVLGTFCARPADAVVRSSSTLILATAMNVSLVPVFIACARGWLPSSVTDTVALLAVFVFIGTCSFVSALSFMHAPTTVAPSERARVGFVFELCARITSLIGAQMTLLLLL